MPRSRSLVRLFTLASLVAALVNSLASRPVVAQEEAPPSVTKFTTDFGYVSTSGNTAVTTLSINEKLMQSRGRLSIEQSFGIVRGQQDGIENTNNLRAGIRTDYKLDSQFALFIGAGYDRNPFAGIERRFEQQLGLQIRAIATEFDTLRFESGATATQQTSTDGTGRQTYPAARVAGTWRHQFSSASYFQQNIEVLPNLDDGEDWRVNTETALIAPISARIGVKLAYILRYDNLPEPTFRTMDRLFVTGIQLTY